MRTLSIMKKFFRYLFYSLLLISILLTLMLTTDWGASLTVRLINQIEGLKIDYKSGAFNNNLVLSSVQFDNETIQLRSHNFSIDWTISCLFKAQVCINRISSAYFSLNILQSPIQDELQPESKLAEVIELPVKIILEKINFSDNHFKTEGLEISLQQLTASIKADGSTVAVIRPVLENLSINLYNAEKSSSIIANQSKVQKNSDWPLENMPEIFIPIDLQLNQFRLENFQVNQQNQDTQQLSLDKILELSSIETSLTAFKNQVDLSNLKIEHPTIASVSARANVVLRDHYPITATITAQIHSLLAYPEINSTTINLTVKGDLSAIQASLESTGPLEIIAQAKLNLAQQKLPFEVEVDARKIPFTEEIDNQISTSSLKFNLEGDISHQRLNLSSLISAGGYQDASVIAKLERIDQEVIINQLTLLDSKTNSDLSIDGTIIYTDQLLWSLNVNTKGFTFPKIVKTVTGRLSGGLKSQGNWNSDNWHVSIQDTQLSGTINQLPAKISGQIDLNEKLELLPSQISIELNNSSLKLKGFTDKQWHLNGQLEVSDVSKWYSDASGSVSTTFEIDGPLKIPRIKLDGGFQNFKFAGVSNKEIAFNVKFQPNILDNKGNLISINQSDIKISLEQTSLDSLDVAPLTLIANGDINQQTIKITSNANEQQLGLNMTLTGLLDPQTDEWNSKLQQFDINSPFGVWKLQHQLSTSTEFKNERVTFNDHCWLGPETKVCLQGSSFNTQKGQVELNISLDLGAISQPFLKDKKMTLDSLLNGNILFEWDQKRQFKSSANLTLERGKISFTELDQALEWSESQIKINSNLEHSEIVVTFNQFERSVLQSILDVNHQQQSITTGQVTLNQFDLSQLVGFSSTIKSLQGFIEASLKISGPFVNPNIEGDIKIKDTNISLASNPTELNEINIIAKLSDKNAQLSGSAKLGKGKAEISGNASWSNQFPELNLNLKGDELTFLYPPDSFANISPDVKLSIKNKDINLTGLLLINDGLIKIEQLPESSLSASEDIIFIDETGKIITDKSVFNTKLDLKILISDKFKVNAMGFEGRIKGDVSLTQQPAKPLQMFGNININEGFYKAYGQDLKVETGQLIFNGSSKNPHINIRAARNIEAEKVKAGIQILGPADQLSLSFYSDPSFDQNEILSYLIRGRGLDSKTGEANPVALLVGTGISSSSKLFKQLDQIPFLSDIEVDSQGEGESTQATISGYVDNRIYIKYGIGVFQPINELTTRLYIMNRLWIETVSSLENSVDIYYSFDIE